MKGETGSGVGTESSSREGGGGGEGEEELLNVLFIRRKPRKQFRSLHGMG